VEKRRILLPIFNRTKFAHSEFFLVISQLIWDYTRS